MSDTSGTISEAGPERAAGVGPVGPAGPRQRRRHPWRIALASLGSVLALAIVAAFGTYAYFNHLVSSIPRVHVAYLTAATGAETFLVTGYQEGPTGSSGQSSGLSNIVMLLHINANGQPGGAVTIPGNVVVSVPGAGSEPLWDALQKGGPSLLVRTVEQLTGDPVNHYARIDFNHALDLVNAIGGVDVTVPAATKGFGYKLPKGTDNLDGLTAIYYARDPSLSTHDRLLRQENLIRAVLTKIGADHLLTNPVTMARVLKAVTSALTVDSNLSNAQVVSLVRKFGGQNGSGVPFVTAPTQTKNGELVLDTPITSQLWTAIKQDSIASFAAKYPSTVTPLAAP